MILTIEMTPVHKKLPDADTNVLLGLADGFTCEWFLDCDEQGAQVWRDVCASPLEPGAVTHWAYMPVMR